MSQPDYPLFSKRIQKSQRNWRGGYNFEKTREYKLAEKWFEERRETIKEPIQPVPKSIVEVPRVPPGLVKTAVKPKYCKVCSKIPNSLYTSECCTSFFCDGCFSSLAELYNRCPCCKKTVNAELVQQFEGLDLKIPSYDEFEYIESIEFLPTYYPDINSLQFQENYTTPHLVEDEEPNQQTDMTIDNFNEMNNTFQLYMQCMILSMMFPVVEPNQEQQA